MSEASELEVKRTPWHLWVMGVVALLWSAMGALDYVMTQTMNEAYMSQFTPEQLAFFTSFPTWVVAAWAVAVWGGVLGATMLLMKAPRPSISACAIASRIDFACSISVSLGLKIACAHSI